MAKPEPHTGKNRRGDGGGQGPGIQAREVEELEDEHPTGIMKSEGVKELKREQAKAQSYAEAILAALRSKRQQTA